MDCLNEIACSLHKAMFYVAADLIQCNLCGCTENLEETLTATYMLPWGYGLPWDYGHAKIYLTPYQQFYIPSDVCLNSRKAEKQ